MILIRRFLSYQNLVSSETDSIHFRMLRSIFFETNGTPTHLEYIAYPNKVHIDVLNGFYVVSLLASPCSPKVIILSASLTVVSVNSVSLVFMQSLYILP